MYHSTPHSTPGKPPGELFFGRMIRNKLPQRDSTRAVDDEEVRDQDDRKKEKGKQYSDERRKAKESEIEVGDVVLVKQEKLNKLSPTFGEEKFTVTEKRGSEVIVESPKGKQLRRKSRFLLKYQENEPNSEDITGNNKQGESEDLNQSGKGTSENQRIRKQPNYLKDYELF